MENAGTNYIQLTILKKLVSFWLHASATTKGSSELHIWDAEPNGKVRKAYMQRQLVTTFEGKQKDTLRNWWNNLTLKSNQASSQPKPFPDQNPQCKQSKAPNKKKKPKCHAEIQQEQELHITVEHVLRYFYEHSSCWIIQFSHFN